MPEPQLNESGAVPDQSPSSFSKLSTVMNMLAGPTLINCFDDKSVEAAQLPAARRAMVSYWGA
ncbi:hypothetical protein D3C78_1951720 [compost metagenome]